MVEDGTEYTYTSGFSRVKDSFVTAGLGFLLFLASFVILGYNEQNNVDEIRTIAECTKHTVEAACGPHYNVNYNSKLVHIQACSIQNIPTWNDPMFVVSAQSLYLRREVWMYQWRETSDRTCTKDKSGGGGEHCVTTYNYDKEWSNAPIPEGVGPNARRYTNPAWPAQFKNSLQAPSAVVAGMYYLPQKLVNELVQDDSQRVTVPLPSSGSLCRPGVNCGIWRVSGAVALNYGGEPQVGNLKVGWTRSSTTDVSAIGVQQPYRGAKWIGAQAQLEAYTSSKNHGHQCFEVAAGSETAKQIWDKKSSANSARTWLLRAGGFLAMWLGLSMVFAPAEVLLDCIPCVGPCISDIVAAGICCAAFTVSASLSLLTIAIAWVVVRPLIGGPILGGAVLFAGLAGYQAHHGKKKRRIPDQGYYYSSAPDAPPAYGPGGAPAYYGPAQGGYAPPPAYAPPAYAGGGYGASGAPPMYAPGGQTMDSAPGGQPVYPSGSQPLYPPGFQPGAVLPPGADAPGGQPVFAPPAQPGYSYGS